jgi:hypothetical protein
LLTRRLQLESLLAGVGEGNLKAMRLGLSHSLSRYKLKFSADKVSICSNLYVAYIHFVAHMQTC